MTNYNERLDEILDKVFMAGLGIAAAEDIAPEHHDTAILNTQKHYTSAAKQALTSLMKELVAEAKPETWYDPDDTDELMRWQGYVDGTTDFENNLLKALEEK